MEKELQERRGGRFRGCWLEGVHVTLQPRLFAKKQLKKLLVQGKVLIGFVVESAKGGEKEGRK